MAPSFHPLTRLPEPRQRFLSVVRPMNFLWVVRPMNFLWVVRPMNFRTGAMRYGQGRNARHACRFLAAFEASLLIAGKGKLACANLTVRLRVIA
jgi:hypothetical protein